MSTWIEEIKKQEQQQRAWADLLKQTQFQESKSLATLSIMNPAPLIIRLADSKGRKYWSSLEFKFAAQENEVVVSHCRVHEIPLTKETECPSCSYNTKDVLEYFFCGNRETSFKGTLDTIGDTTYVYTEFGEDINILSHLCDEGSYSVDAVLNNNEIIARCVRETCILCGSKVGRKETVNFLRLKGGVE